MKRVVTGGELTQRDMRPADIIHSYLTHVQDDIARFGLLEDARERDCPACGGQGAREFERFGFEYHRCRMCGSLFVSPLPAGIRLAEYHAEGAAERFRREHLLPSTADVRTRHALIPRARWVLAAAAGRLGLYPTFAQFGTETPQLLDLIRASATVVSWPDTSQPERDQVQADGVIAFDELERAADFAGGIHRCRRTLRAGGLLFVTTMSGEGFELCMLGQRANALVPPVHLQLLSRRGWNEVLAREDFRIVEYSTPGELDVQAVADVCRRDPAVRLPAIIDQLVHTDDEQVARAFQGLLQQACLSSHVHLMAEALRHGV